jgi:hypothetical protein
LAAIGKVRRVDLGGFGGIFGKAATGKAPLSLMESARVRKLNVKLQWVLQKLK